ncbi:trimeric intracellular cation channel family protein [Clostridium cadaveris]|uniref:trimeric intracellular cation channel family protein n=1 Tax=Clostridium cadaveris TaxID=1529 RepID=UPI0031DDBC0F
MILLLNVFEAIGTIAFAISGALIGIEKKLDIFGISFLSITTALGGGIFRDILIGKTPPTAFVNPQYMIVAIIVALITYKFNSKVRKLQGIISLCDSIGLAVFTAIGANAAFSNGFDAPLIVVAMGVFTGVGGGILRDVFVKDIPFVFRKEVYAVACLIGALAFYFVEDIIPREGALYVCFLITFITRILSIKFDLNLPAKKEVFDRKAV